MVAFVMVAFVPILLTAKKFPEFRFTTVPEAIVPVANIKLPELNKFVEKKLVVVALVPVAFVKNRSEKVATREFTMAEKKLVEVEFVTDEFTANIFVPVASLKFSKWEKNIVLVANVRDALGTKRFVTVALVIVERVLFRLVKVPVVPVI
jgi:hypothetical protein